MRRTNSLISDATFHMGIVWRVLEPFRAFDHEGTYKGELLLQVQHRHPW